MSMRMKLQSPLPGEQPNQYHPRGFTLIELLVVIAICGKSDGIWHCPADMSYGITPQGQRVARPRSMSMSNWVGGNGDSPENGYKGGWGLTAPGSTVARKLSDITAGQPGPSMTFVLLDERP